VRSVKVLSVGAPALLAAVLIAACGGGSGDGDEDPQQVLDETFTSGEAKDVKSGVVEFILDASGRSAGEDGSFNVSFGGPFQGSGDGQLPGFDFSFDFAVNSPDEDVSFAGAATSTGDAGFLTFMGTTYEVDGETFDGFKTGFEEAQADPSGGADSSSQLEEFGIDPTNWFTNLTNEGTEDVEGTETIHISGDANIPEIIEDLQSAAAQAGDQAPEIPADQLTQIGDFVSEARIDVFTGADDRILRRLAVRFAIDIPEDAQEGGGNFSVDLSVTLSQLNEEQTITAPADAQPLSELFGMLPLLRSGGGGLDSLQDLGLEIPGIAPDVVPGVPEDPGSGAPVVPEVPEVEPGQIPEEAQAYLDCVGAAQSPTDLQDCVAEFQP